MNTKKDQVILVVKKENQERIQENPERIPENHERIQENQERIQENQKKYKRTRKICIQEKQDTKNLEELFISSHIKQTF